MSTTPPKSKSVVRASKAANTADAKARHSKKSKDSFANFGQNFGIGTDSPLSTGTYGFNPITRNRTLLEWMHRGNWLAGVAVDVVADDMTRSGIEIQGSMDPNDIAAIGQAATRLGVWTKLNETIKWGRLYGGAIAVMLIDGQDVSSPLRLKTVRKGQFCGLLVLDRWMVDPSLNDLVTEFGPALGQPKYYTVVAQAPALSRMKIHYSRVVRLEGVQLPFQQKLTENLWGLSVLERLYDRMVSFDSATIGAAQLVYKAYIRTYKIDGLREIVAAGGDALSGLISYVDMMRRFQGNEGVTLMDKEDEFEGHVNTAFSGLSDALQQFAQQLSGALQIPLVRLFGQSPAGFSSGDSDMRNYYDTINQQQEKDLRNPITTIYYCIAASLGIQIPDDAEIVFKSLWQLSDVDKSTVATNVASAITSVESAGLISQATALRELRQSGQTTGIFSTITDAMITEADDTLPPMPETEGSEEGEGGTEPKAGGKVDPALKAPSLE